MNGKVIITLLVTAVITTATSCRKDKSESDYEVSVSQDMAFAENTLIETGKIVDQAGLYTELVNYRNGNNNTIMQPGCATVTVENVSATEKRVKMDFGVTDVTCRDGKRRRGVIYLTYDGSYLDLNKENTVSFENFFVNDYKINGTSKVIYTGKNAQNQSVYSIVDDITINNPNGKVMTWKNQATRTFVSGESTTYSTDGLAGVTDDVLQLSGSGSGVSFNGTSFTVNITEPLVLNGDCRFITKGKAEVTPSGMSTRTIDFGDGTCDTQIGIVINGVTYFRNLE
jgi:hypothetical protein